MRTLHLLHIIRDVATSLVLAGAVSWYLLRQRVPIFPRASQVEAPPAVIDREAHARQHARWFVHMRWIAAAVTLVLIVIAVPVTGMLPTVTLVPLFLWWSALVAANLVFAWWVRRGSRPDRQIVVQALLDLAVLTGLLNASGGIE
jgi:hypothetical protein